MEGLRHPVGHEPSDVYWRRRILVIAGVVLLGLVLWFLISASFGGNGDSPEPGARDITSPNASPSPSISGGSIDPALARACAPEDVTITTTPNPFEVGPGALPVFDVTIEHVGFSACKLDTASDGTELLITSGSDRIFSSADCADDATINERAWILQPDNTETFQVTWNRQRSNEECTTVTAEPGVGYYIATLTIQGIESEPAQFRLTE